MTPEQSIVTGDALQKMGSVGFILGAVLIIGSGLMMPFAPTSTSNLKEMLKPLGEQQFRTQLSSLLMSCGFWSAIVGATAVYRSIAEFCRYDHHFIGPSVSVPIIEPAPLDETVDNRILPFLAANTGILDGKSQLKE